MSGILPFPSRYVQRFLHKEILPGCFLPFPVAIHDCSSALAGCLRVTILPPTMAPSGLGGFEASLGVLSAAHRKLSTASMMLSAASQGPSAQTHCLTISTPCSYTVTLWGAGDCGSHHFGRSKSLGCVCPRTHEALVSILTHSLSPESPQELGGMK